MSRIRYHTVRPGDTLESISNAYYRSPEFDDYIYQHNLHTVPNPNRLDIGQNIAIPHLPAIPRLISLMDD